MEKAVQFTCNGNRLYGILHLPDDREDSDCLVTMVTGGFQPRFGGHRLYIQIARFLCSHNITVFRFDYQGMGDSNGKIVGFGGAGPSIRAAIDYLRQALPNISETILWSLCDGCPISIIYATGHEHEIDGLILCNPFMFYEKGSRELAHIKYYYLKRIVSGQFWRRLFTLKINLAVEAATLWYSFREILLNKLKLQLNLNELGGLPLQNRVLRGILKLSKPIYLIFSTKDMGAMEFQNMLFKRERFMQKISSKKLILYEVEGADHTFTEPPMKDRLFELTLKALYQMRNDR
jgi:uncharacterized protein